MLTQLMSDPWTWVWVITAGAALVAGFSRA